MTAQAWSCRQGDNVGGGGQLDSRSFGWVWSRAPGWERSNGGMHGLLPAAGCILRSQGGLLHLLNSLATRRTPLRRQ